MMEKNLRRNVVEIAKKAYNDGLVAGTSGNVSEYDHDTSVMAITPSNMDYTVMTEKDIVLMNLDGEVLEGELKPSSEWRMHAGIYKNRKDLNSVIHTHSPYATSFAVLREEVPIVLVEMLPFIGGEIPVSKFGMPGTDELGENAIISLEKRFACLLENHGVLAVGKSAAQAYIRAVYVEDAAKIYHFARQIGDPKWVSESVIEKMRKK